MPEIRVILNFEEKELLNEQAIRFQKTWGKRPNITALIKAIACGEIKLELTEELEDTEKTSLSISEQDALIEVLRDSIQAGHKESVDILKSYLIELKLSKIHKEAIASL